MSTEARKILQQEFGQRLRSAREAKGLSRMELSGIVDLSDESIKSYELGRSYPVPDVIVRMSHALNVSTQWLLEGQEWTGSSKDGENQLEVDERLSSYIELVTDPDMLIKVKPTYDELHQLYLASIAGGIRDWVQLVGLLNDIRSVKIGR